MRVRGRGGELVLRVYSHEHPLHPKAGWCSAPQAVMVIASIGACVVFGDKQG